MEQSDIGDRSDSIKDCLRCGKCKPVCATHVPRANLLYSPRNKILATSLLIEGLPVRRANAARRLPSSISTSSTTWPTIAPSATSARTPCPVDIDFGDVSIAMRNLLRKQGKKKFNPGTAASMFFLNATDPATIKLAQTLMIGWGYKAQRFAHSVEKAGLAAEQTRRPPATVGKPPIKAQVIHFINKPMPGNLPKKTARALLDIEDNSIVPIIRDPA